MTAARKLTDEDVTAIARAVVAEMRAPAPQPSRRKRRQYPTRAPSAEGLEEMTRRERRAGRVR